MATNYDVLLEKIRALGMDYRWAGMFVKKLRDDEVAFPVEDMEKRRWALEKGFYPGRIELYGLTEENWKDYMPDFQYFMLHPLNNHFLKWLDKTTLKYVLNSGGVESVMPEYYVYVENDLCGGRYTYLMDCPKDIPKDENFLWNLLQEKKVLAMKPNSGTSGGKGFMKGLVCTKPVGKVAAKALEQGLIVITAGADVIRLVPPLIIQKEHIDEMIEKLSAVLSMEIA